MENKYVIRIGNKTSNGSSYKWGYYDGHIYKYKNEYFVDDFFQINQAKRYLQRNTAEKEAEKLYDKCSNVDVWLVEEIKE